MQIYSILIVVCRVSCFMMFKKNSSLYISSINDDVIMSYDETPVDFVQKDRDPGNVYLKNGDDLTYTLDILNGLTDVVFAKFHGHNHQVFSLLRNEDGSYSIRSSQDGRCLEVVEDFKLIPTTCKISPNQKFDIYESPKDDDKQQPLSPYEPDYKPPVYSPRKKNLH
eukprot:jgi/Antlo1/1873/1551